MTWIRPALRIAVLFATIRYLIAKPLPAHATGAGLLVSLIALLVAGLLEEDYERKWLTVVLTALLLEVGRLGMTYAAPTLAKLR